MANWALQTPPKFTTGVKYEFHQGFDQIRDPEILITFRPVQHQKSTKNKDHFTSQYSFFENY